MAAGNGGSAERGEASARGRRLIRWLVLVLAAISATTSGVQAQDEGAELRFVHGVSGVGALDLYVDGAAAIFGADFASTSDALTLAEGEHRLSLVPTGAGPDAALVEESIETAAGTSVITAVLGTADDVQLFLYDVDRSPLEEGEARLRVVHAAPDIGPVDVAITGGDLLFPTVDYPNATDYADVEAAIYDFELRLAASDQVALALPGTDLAAGQILDLFAVGQVADGSLQALAVETVPESSPAEEPVAGGVVEIRSGECGDPGELLAEIDGPVAPSGGAVGEDNGFEVASAVGTLPIAFDELVAGGVVLVSVEDGGDAPLTCGPISGSLTDEGGLVVGLRGPGGTGATGIALFAPGAADPATSDVAVYLVEGAPGGGVAGAGSGGDGDLDVLIGAGTPEADRPG